MPKTCNTCVQKTKKGRLCSRRTCKGTNLPYCWQHLPAAQKGTDLPSRYAGSTELVHKNGLNEAHDHLKRVFGSTKEELDIINYQLAFVKSRKWQMRIWRDPRTATPRGHVIMQPILSARRIAHEFGGQTAAVKRHLLKGSMYVQSSGIEKGYKKRDTLRILYGSYTNPLMVHVEKRADRAEHKRLGFVKIPELSSRGRTAMVRK